MDTDKHGWEKDSRELVPPVLRNPGSAAGGAPVISLCMIAGNEERVILRCLESARGAFDELCLVQAVGEQPADATTMIARMWCVAKGKLFRTATYRNEPSQQGSLPHVDNFGAARNLSFSLARGDWLLWLDCDDYLDEVNCQRIREAVRAVPAEWAGIMCEYLVEKGGGVILRERLIRRGMGRWKNAIHEHCVMAGPVGECRQIQIFHGEHGHKHESSAKRNLAILERVVEEAPRHYYYLHAELKMLSQSESPDVVSYKERAIKAGRAALELLDEGQAEERYRVHLNLSELEPEKREEHLLEAVRLQPHRREAFANLCQVAINEGRVSDAISFFRLMDALPLPSPLPWTHQGIWHGWARNFLRVRVLRLSGKSEMAGEEHGRYLQDPEYAAGVKEFESHAQSAQPKEEKAAA